MCSFFLLSNVLLFLINYLFSYRDLFMTLDMTKEFYFSYTYDLTNSLQVNMCGSTIPSPDHNQSNQFPFYFAF